MDEAPYSKREQDKFQQELMERIGRQDVQLNRIEAQTIKTNGRVTALEWWKSAIIWGLGIIGLIALTLLPTLWKYEFRTQTITTRTTINQ